MRLRVKKRSKTNVTVYDRVVELKQNRFVKMSFDCYRSGGQTPVDNVDDRLMSIPGNAYVLFVVNDLWTTCDTLLFLFSNVHLFEGSIKSRRLSVYTLLDSGVKHNFVDQNK